MQYISNFPWIFHCHLRRLIKLDDFMLPPGLLVFQQKVFLVAALSIFPERYIRTLGAKPRALPSVAFAWLKRKLRQDRTLTGMQMSCHESLYMIEHAGKTWKNILLTTHFSKLNSTMQDCPSTFYIFYHPPRACSSFGATIAWDVEL